MKVTGLFITMSEETGNPMPIVILDVERGREEGAMREINRRMLQHVHLGTRWKVKVLWGFKEMMELVRERARKG